MTKHTHTLKDLVDRCQKQFQVLVLAVSAFAFVVLNVHLPLRLEQKITDARQAHDHVLAAVNDAVNVAERATLVSENIRKAKSEVIKCANGGACVGVQHLLEGVYEVRDQLNDQRDRLNSLGDSQTQSKRFIDKMNKPATGPLAPVSLASALVAGPPLLLILFVWFGAGFERLANRVAESSDVKVEEVEWFLFHRTGLSRFASCLALLLVPAVILVPLAITESFALPALAALRLGDVLAFATPQGRIAGLVTALLATGVSLWLLRLRARAIDRKPGSEQAAADAATDPARSTDES